MAKVSWYFSGQDLPVKRLKYQYCKLLTFLAHDQQSTIALATSAAIIASQALISGSFTFISEAIRLNLWPKMKIKYPSEARGQLFIPGINALLFVGCCGIVLYFQKATNMEAAYGLAITICVLPTTILFANYLVVHRTKPLLIYVFLGQ